MNAGDRIINEHDEDEPGGNEELYFVLHGRAVFELDGERVDAPAGTFVFARPGVKRTAFAEEPGTTVIALGGTPGKAYEPHGWELWAPLARLYEAGEYAEAGRRGCARWSRRIPSTPTSSTTSPAARASPAGPTDAIEHLAARDRAVAGAVARARTGRLGLRSDSRRARVQGADRPLALEMSAHRLTKAQARRIAVRAQLLDAPRPTDLLAVVQQLTLLQIDPTAAIAPSADLVAWSRLGSAYQPADLKQALEEDRTLFELDALIRPMGDLGLYLAGADDWPSYERTRAWLRDNDALPARHPRAARPTPGRSPRATSRTRASCRGPRPAGRTTAT